MLLLRNIVALFNVIVICLSLCPITYAAPITGLDQQTGLPESVLEAQPEQLNSSFPTIFGGFIDNMVKDFPNMMYVLFQPPTNDLDVNENNTEHSKTRTRFKRQSGGKFSDASKMSSTKMMQLYLQMFRNLVSGAPVGGIHPMSPGTVKPIVGLFKQRIISFFFPDVGDDKD